jgi:hypothetical protein
VLPAGLSHIDSVILLPEMFNEGEFGADRYSPAPLNLRPPPYLPDVHVPPCRSATLPLAEESPAVVPWFSLKAQPATSPAGGGGWEFDTVTVLEPLGVPVLPAASRALALSTCTPLDAVVVSQVMPYGAVVSSEPSGWPSWRNCTPATPTSSLAVAATLTLPDTTAPAAGAVTDTLGGDVSGAGVVALTADDLADSLPAASTAETL